MLKKKVKILINLPGSLERNSPVRYIEVENSLTLLKDRIRAINQERTTLLKESILRRLKGKTHVAQPNSSTSNNFIKPTSKLFPQFIKEFLSRHNEKLNANAKSTRNNYSVSPKQGSCNTKGVHNLAKNNYSPSSKLRSVVLSIMADKEKPRFAFDHKN
eukprot:TRINITY_DN9178_c0_g1_i3.p1 TRINITY_DN9178_c0_g1~~TRINITY_DN9178_c0_g1_i3.p1  ORF type:complete len:159 (-),score=12.69 TRINITY_DN9178_c0_g1_i3:371-847(-)